MKLPISRLNYPSQPLSDDTFVVVDKRINDQWVSYKLNLANLREYINQGNSPGLEHEPTTVQLWENGPRWATTNIGASQPQETGKFYQFGDLVGYTPDVANNRWVGDDGSTDHWFKEEYQLFPKTEKERLIETLLSQGWIAYDSQYQGYVLASAHDVATQKFGYNYKIPTQQDWNDLITKCDWTSDTIQGVSGIKITGRGDYSLNSIFLPQAGYAQNSNNSSVSNGNTSYVCFYTSSLRSTGHSEGLIIGNCWIYHSGRVGLLQPENVVAWTTFYGGFYWGTPIRPIKIS